MGHCMKAGTRRSSDKQKDQHVSDTGTAGTKQKQKNDQKILEDDRAIIWLLVWLSFNIGVTLLNKSAFSSADFNYPYFVSGLHMLFNIAGCRLVFATTAVKARGPRETESLTGKGLWDIKRKELDRKGKLTMLIFSFIFSLNVAIGNLSLSHVSVSFNQVVRSLIPAFTILLRVMLNKPTSRARLLAVMPVVVGVAMACYGDMSYSSVGFIITIFCVVLSALKVVASGEMLTGQYNLHPVDLLAHMAPLAMVQCWVMSLMTGEMSEIARRWQQEFNPLTAPSPKPFLIVVSGACVSFLLNVTSFIANKKTSPLTLCIASNVKQVLVIALGMAMFGEAVNFLNGLGIVTVLVASARYSKISVAETMECDYDLKQTAARESATPEGQVDPVLIAQESRDVEIGGEERAPLVSDKNQAEP